MLTKLPFLAHRTRRGRGACGSVKHGPSTNVETHSYELVRACSFHDAMLRFRQRTIVDKAIRFPSEFPPKALLHT